jgi:pyridoxal phosphate enzyme (YggS family)
MKFRYQELLGRITEVQKISPFGQNVTLIAVSKTQPVSAVRELYDLGHRDFGENYVQEILEKKTLLESQGINDIRWHFIGHLQSNKVGKIVSWINSIHSVDRLSLLEELNRKCSAMSRTPLNIFLEVNLDSEPSKSGFSEKNLIATLPLMSNFGSLKIVGLMTIPNPNLDGEVSFKRLRELSCRLFTGNDSKMLSMGMSQDFEKAILQGATHIRVGTSLFGPRH